MLTARKISLAAIMLVATTVALPAGDRPSDKGVMHTVDASVTYSAGTHAGTNVLAELQPGYFTVRPRQIVHDFKYFFVDPKSGIERDKLNDHTIYCETTKQWVKIPADPKTLELPPGDYKFVVGGSPGANGTLNFRTFYRDSSPPPADGAGRPKPPSGTLGKDTAKTGTRSDPLHPGGEGRSADPRKGSQLVSVHWQGLRTTGDTEAPFDGKTPARLTVADGRFELEFVLEPPRSETVKGERAVIRWEGIIAGETGAGSVEGTTREDHVWSDNWGGRGFSRGSGTFEGQLAGSTWKGSMKERGETKASQVDKADSYHMEAEWSIDVRAAGKVVTQASPGAANGKPE